MTLTTEPLADVQALWRERVIEPEDLQPRRVYYLRSRNLTYGVYAPPSDERWAGSFIGIRTKFDRRFLDDEVARGREANGGTAWTQGATPYTVPAEIELWTRESYVDADGDPRSRTYEPLFLLLDGLPLGALDFIPDLAAVSNAGDRAHLPVEQWRSGVQLTACGRRMHRFDWTQGDYYARQLLVKGKLCVRCGDRRQTTASDILGD